VSRDPLTEAWYRLVLDDALTAWDEVESLREDCQAAWRAAAEPDGMAVFLRHESEGRLHCRAVLYFTPGAAPLALRYAARVCARPHGAGLSLLAGSPAAERLLPPPSP